MKTTIAALLLLTTAPAAAQNCGAIANPNKCAKKFGGRCAWNPTSNACEDKNSAGGEQGQGGAVAGGTQGCDTIAVQKQCNNKFGGKCLWDALEGICGENPANGGEGGEQGGGEQGGGGQEGGSTTKECGTILNEALCDVKWGGLCLWTTATGTCEANPAGGGSAGGGSKGGGSGPIKRCDTLDEMLDCVNKWLGICATDGSCEYTAVDCTSLTEFFCCKKWGGVCSWDSSGKCVEEESSDTECPVNEGVEFYYPRSAPCDVSTDQVCCKKWGGICSSDSSGDCVEAVESDTECPDSEDGEDTPEDDADSSEDGDDGGGGGLSNKVCDGVPQKQCPKKWGGICAWKNGKCVDAADRMAKNQGMMDSGTVDPAKQLDSSGGAVFGGRIVIRVSLLVMLLGYQAAYAVVA